MDGDTMSREGSEWTAAPRPEPATLEEAKAQIAELERQLEQALFEAGVLRLQLDMLSSTDTLTGMPNVNGIAQALEKSAARAERSGESFGLMAVDIPMMAKFDQNADREAFEDAVRHAGAMITACLRRLDTVGRIEDGAFVLVLPMLGPEGVKAVTQRIERLLLQTPFLFGGQPVRLTPAFTVVLSNVDQPNEPHRMLTELFAARVGAKPGTPVTLHTAPVVDPPVADDGATP
jgi:diguanylate cyclase (GGDEF)-like protein